MNQFAYPLYIMRFRQAWHRNQAVVICSRDLASAAKGTQTAGVTPYDAREETGGMDGV